MIGKIAEHVVGELNEYLSLLSSVQNEHAVAASLFDLEGAPNAKAKDKLVVSIVKIEQDRVYHSIDIYNREDAEGTKVTTPEVQVNIYFLITANYTNYQEAMKAISRVVSFFQRRNAFDIEPDIIAASSARNHIVFEMVSLSFEQQNNLWSMLGNKYMPSVLYKAGIVGIQDEQIERVAAPVREIHINES